MHEKQPLELKIINMYWVAAMILQNFKLWGHAKYRWNNF